MSKANIDPFGTVQRPARASVKNQPSSRLRWQITECHGGFFIVELNQIELVFCFLSRSILNCYTESGVKHSSYSEVEQWIQIISCKRTLGSFCQIIGLLDEFHGIFYLVFARYLELSFSNLKEPVIFPVSSPFLRVSECCLVSSNPHFESGFHEE
jgi:hypothetical protein